MYLVWFSVAWVVAMYLINVLIARKFPQIEPKKLFAYIGAMIFLGVFGEVFIGTIFNFIFGWPLWHYRLLPVHGDYTSIYSIVIWAIYGFHLYLLHGTMAKSKKPLPSWKLACIFAFEAVLLEIAINIAHIAVTGQYIFYYYPPDLFHLTSLVALPIYFIAGYAMVKTLPRFSRDPLFFGTMSFLAVITLLFFAT